MSCRVGWWKQTLFDVKLKQCEFSLVKMNESVNGHYIKRGIMRC